MDTVLLALAAVLTAATGWCVLLAGVGGFAGVVRALIRLYD